MRLKHLFCISLVFWIFNNKNKAQDTLSNFINELQHTSTAFHHGHIALKKIYSRIDYTNTNFSGDLPNLHRFNVEASYRFNKLGLGVLYNNNLKTNTTTQKYSGITSLSVLNKKLKWIISGGIHITYKTIQYENLLFRNEEPINNHLKSKLNSPNLSFSNLILFKNIFLSSSVTNIMLGYKSYIPLHNLLGFHFKIHDIEITPSIKNVIIFASKENRYPPDYNYNSYSKEEKKLPDYYYLDRKLSLNLTGQYKKIILGFSVLLSGMPIYFRQTQYMISAGYCVSNNFYFNINAMIYRNSFLDKKNYVQNFKLSFLYIK